MSEDVKRKEKMKEVSVGTGEERGAQRGTAWERAAESHGGVGELGPVLQPESLCATSPEPGCSRAVHHERDPRSATKTQHGQERQKKINKRRLQSQSNPI